MAVFFRVSSVNRRLCQNRKKCCKIESYKNILSYLKFDIERDWLLFHIYVSFVWPIDTTGISSDFHFESKVIIAVEFHSQIIAM